MYKGIPVNNSNFETSSIGYLKIPIFLPVSGFVAISRMEILRFSKMDSRIVLMEGIQHHCIKYVA